MLGMSQGNVPLIFHEYIFARLVTFTMTQEALGTEAQPWWPMKKRNSFLGRQARFKQRVVI